MIVGIFCSSRDIALQYESIVVEVITTLFVMFKKTITIVYGGGTKGLMGIVYRECNNHGIHVIGHNLQKWTLPELSHEIIYPTLLERQQGIVESSDMYLIFPGGIGTLYELCHVLCNNDVENKNKMVIVYNVNHIFDTWLRFIDELIDKKLMDEDRLVLHIATSITELEHILLLIKNEN